MDSSYVGVANWVECKTMLDVKKEIRKWGTMTEIDGVIKVANLIITRDTIVDTLNRKVLCEWKKGCWVEYGQTKIQKN